MACHICWEYVSQQSWKITRRAPMHEKAKTFCCPAEGYSVPKNNQQHGLRIGLSEWRIPFYLTQQREWNEHFQKVGANHRSKDRYAHRNSNWFFDSNDRFCLLKNDDKPAMKRNACRIIVHSNNANATAPQAKEGRTGRVIMRWIIFSLSRK